MAYLPGLGRKLARKLDDHGMRNNHTYLYTLYRNSDDRQMVLDGRGSECARLMGVTYQWFYKLMMNGGSNRKWTITRRRKDEDEEDE